MSVKQMGMVWDLDLPANKKLVLLAYADHADHDGGSVYPSLGRIAHKTGYSRRQVIRTAHELVKSGLMEKVRESTHDAPAEYRLRLERGDILAPLRKRGVTNDPPGVGSQMSPEPSLEPSVNTPTGEGKPSASEVGELCQYLREELQGADVPLLKGREGRYGKEFKELLAKGLSQDVLYKACDRINERWRSDDHKKLSVEHALEDVINGKPPANVTNLPTWSKGTAPELIDYVFENTRNSYIRSCERRLRSTMARFDFASDEQPPWKIEKELGGTDNERWATLDGLRALCKRGSREVVA
jgi:Helix-turn-helix domain